MRNSSLAHYTVIHSAAQVSQYAQRKFWPWSTGVLALTATVVGVAAILTVELTMVRNSPAITKAREVHETELRQAKLRSEAMARIPVFDQRLSELKQATHELEITLQDKLGITGNGVTYAELDTPLELDRIIEANDNGALDAWNTIEESLANRLEIEALTVQGKAFTARSTYAAGDIETMDAALGKAATMLEQVRAGQAAADHLVVLLQVEKLRDHLPKQKEQ